MKKIYFSVLLVAIAISTAACGYQTTVRSDITPTVVTPADNAANPAAVTPANPDTTGVAADLTANVTTTPPPATNPVTPAPVPVINTAAVGINNFAFSPTPLTIKAGTKVVWTNNDNAPHSITSDTGSLLDSVKLSTGESFGFVFTTAGSFSYHCAVHPNMKGTIIVEK